MEVTVRYPHKTYTQPIKAPFRLRAHFSLGKIYQMDILRNAKDNRFIGDQIAAVLHINPSEARSLALALLAATDGFESGKSFKIKEEQKLGQLSLLMNIPEDE